MHSCLAIVVTYNPEGSVLLKQLQALSPQVSKILLLDNASLLDPTEQLAAKELSNIVIKRLSSNQGLALAYNYGIDYAKRHLFTHVLLMDQDSIPECDMVDKLYAAEQLLLAKGINFAALGANYADRDNDKTVYINSDNCPVKRYTCTEKQQFLACDHVISSGSLIPLSVIRYVGVMDERLFIDLVDVEWGLRAKSKGYQCHAVCDAKMYHLIGEASYKVPLVNKRLNLHSPLRYYYQFRNSFLMYRRDYTSWCWIRYHFSRHILFKLLYCTLFTAPRGKNLKMMLLGIYHGIVGRNGKYREKEKSDSRND